MTKIVVLFVSMVTISLCAIDAGAEEGPSLIEGKKIYMHYCTSCHGEKGDGRGFNAKNLDPRPANHTDADMMSRRSDNDLREAVSGGGRRVGKATLMPPWGGVLSDVRIESLVQYMRKLCKCKEQ